MENNNEKNFDLFEFILSIFLVIGFLAIIIFDIIKVVKLIKRIAGTLGCSCCCDDCCIETEATE